MTERFGVTEFGNRAAQSGASVRLPEGPLDLTWSYCGATADFIADFYAAQAREAGVNYTEARQCIGYMANELLENAVKFRALGDVLVETALDGDRFQMRVTNRAEPAVADRFKEALAEIFSRDSEELLIERIERNAVEPSSSASGLGLITLINDYGAILGWTFELDGPEEALTRIETYASLVLTSNT